ncbi:MAG TPA: hypothetical protein VF939_02495 [Puia sp.]
MTNTEILANREDIAKSRDSLRGETTKIKEDLLKMDTRLTIKLIELKSDIINWMLGLFAIIMAGILVLYFKR